MASPDCGSTAMIRSPSYAATRWAADRARSNHGATIIELFTYRVEGHSTSDDPTAYRTPEAARKWPLGDPIVRLKQHLIAIGEWDEERHLAQVKEVEQEVRAAQKQAEELGTMSTAFDPERVASMFEDVFQTMPWHLREQQQQMLDETEAWRKLTP
jgi:2-oxoisovalerate dehydrogenase E1 component alpha subunit